MLRPRAPAPDSHGLPLRTLTDARWVALALRRELAHSEHGHPSLFFRLAVKAAGFASASERLNTLLDREAEIVLEVGIRPAIH